MPATKIVLASSKCVVPVLALAMTSIAWSQQSPTTWRADSTDPVIVKQTQGFPVSGAESAAGLQAWVAEKTGVLSIDTRVNPATKTINIEFAPVAVTSPTAYTPLFAPIQGKVLKTTELEATSRIAQAAARNNNETLQVNLGQAPAAGAAMPLAVTSAPSADAPCSGSALFSTYGQRYSGRNIVSLSGGCRIGYETSIQANASYGLASISEDSRGGHYRSLGLEVEHVFPWAISTTRYSETDYLQGGSLLAFGQGGHIKNFTQEFAKPLSGSSTLLYGFGVNEQTSRFQSVGFEDTTRFTNAMLGFSWRKEAGQANIKLYQGLGGSRSFNAIPLSGDVDPKFTAVTVDGKSIYRLDRNATAEFTVAAQIGSKGAPSSMQFYGGGLDRGRAFIPGNIAGPSGIAGSAALVYPLNKTISGYIGIDGAVVSQNVGSNQSESSAYIGARGQVANSVSFDATYALPITAPQGIEKPGRFTLRLNAGF